MHGERTVRIELDGYKPWQQKFQLAAGGKRDLPNVLLTKADGYLQVTSLPVGASISVDGRFKGKSPLKLAIEPDKQHEVAAVKAGYARGSRQVKVASGETTAVQLELEPELATVHFVTDPSDAELLIDGKPRGSATQSLQLPTHEHRILVQRDGYGSYETTITPRKGVRKRIKIRLKTTAEIGAAQKSAARGVSSAGRLTTYVGSELKLFRGGDVTLGSSRRDPGRRANEAMYSVKLARPFYISLKEVTNADFRKFLANHVSAPFGGVEMNADAQPVVGLPWENAAIFCNWLSRKDSLPVFYQIKHGKVLGINPDATGYRLPSEAEWGWVARTTAGGEPFDFPWAGNYPPRGQSGNYADASASHLLGDVLKDYNDGYAVTAPVGSYPANLRGIYDLGGNVAEWVHDFYTATPAGGNSAKVDPLGPRSGESHVIRGSSWARSSLTELRLAYRDSGTAGRDDVGFRIARYAQ
jgi:formylglycine-generating enzyme required for sulfatase activity